MSARGVRGPAVVEDPVDPRVEDYVALTDVARRHRLESEYGLFIAEGEQVVRRALRAGYPPRSLLVDARRAEALNDLAVDAPTYVASYAVLRAVTGFHVHRGILASFDRLPLPEPAALLPGARRLAVVEGVNNTTNLGAIFRAAAGLGVDAVLLDPRCADPLYRRAVRVSMGQVFAVPHARFRSWPGDLELLRAAGFTLLALTPGPAAVDLDQWRPAAGGRVALLIGAEGPGLSAGALDTVDMRVRIPMARGVDSLNVGAAAAVAFWALR